MSIYKRTWDRGNIRKQAAIYLEIRCLEASLPFARIVGTIDLDLGHEREHSLDHQVVNVRQDLAGVVAPPVQVGEHRRELPLAALASLRASLGTTALARILVQQVDLRDV